VTLIPPVKLFLAHFDIMSLIYVTSSDSHICNNIDIITLASLTLASNSLILSTFDLNMNTGVLVKTID